MQYGELFGLNTNDSVFMEHADSELFQNLREFINLRQLYSAGILEVRTKLEILDEEFQVRYDHNPIHHMETRLKTPRSILEKLQRRDLPTTLDAMRENILDIAGIRVICYYIDDIYRMAELLITQDDITPIRTRNYIAHPKPNGYRSLHLVVSVPVFLAERRELVPVEIQIRTIAMDFWASLDHEMRYKKEDNVPEQLREELRECAEAAAALDIKMQDIHQKLHSAAKESAQAEMKECGGAANSVLLHNAD
ncbi:MAG: GTP pyrophosphokinase family protein [Clostridiaceae bacterium]|nr:GTP pyrophosphokinase family protein [Clostridiaceae bacterium]